MHAGHVRIAVCCIHVRALPDKFPTIHSFLLLVACGNMCHSSHRLISPHLGPQAERNKPLKLSYGLVGFEYALVQLFARLLSRQRNQKEGKSRRKEIMILKQQLGKETQVDSDLAI